MTVCHHCGQDMPQAAQWNDLRVTSTGQADWRGIPIALPPAECRILMALARLGQASRDALERTYAGVTPVTVFISMLRDRLAETPVRIRSVYGVGYRLELTA